MNLNFFSARIMYNSFNVRSPHCRLLKKASQEPSLGIGLSNGLNLDEVLPLPDSIVKIVTQIIRISLTKLEN